MPSFFDLSDDPKPEPGWMLCSPNGHVWFHRTRPQAVAEAVRVWIDPAAGRTFDGKRTHKSQWAKMKREGWNVQRAYVVSSRRLAVLAQTASWASRALLEAGDRMDRNTRDRLAERVNASVFANR